MATRQYSPRGAERAAERRERRASERRATMERREARAFKYAAQA